MKSSRTKIVGIALALALLAAVGLSQTVQRVQMHHGPGMFGGEGMLHYFAQQLDLTDAQQAQIKQIIENEKPTLKPLFQKEMQTHHALMQLVMSGNFDEAKAQAIASQGAQTHTQLEVQHARIAAEAYKVLTPEQRTKLAQLIAQHEQEHMQHMQKSEGEPEE